MKKACVTTAMIFTLAFAGCGGTGALSSDDVTDNEVMSVALTDGDALLVSEAEVSDGMNASIAKAVSQKIQSELEEQLANGDIDEFLLENGEDEVDTSKDITVGFTLRWKIASMSANLRTAIAESNVVATGSIADREVVGRVDMVDVAMDLSNNDLLKQPKNFAISCGGVISTTINDQEFEICEISPTCTACIK